MLSSKRVNGVRLMPSTTHNLELYQASRDRPVKCRGREGVTCLKLDSTAWLVRQRQLSVVP
jgi:hypothetical protein